MNYLNILLACILLSSCQLLSDFGAVNLNKIEKEQQKGNFDPELVIIEITSENISTHNKYSSEKHGKVPSSNIGQTYSDLITVHDKLNLLVLDSANNQGALGDGTTSFGPIEVPENGVISFPYAGEFVVIGMSIAELQKEIQEKYRTTFNTAEVTLVRTIRQNFTANVIGNVTTPGNHELTRKGITITDLIAQSGGIKIEPHLCEYKLHRNHKTYKLTEHLVNSGHILAQDGDVMEVAKKTHHEVTVIGAVRKPGNHDLKDKTVKLSLLLGEASGLELENSDARGVFVIRKKRSNYSDIYRFNMKKPQGLIMATRFNILPGDVVYVTEAPLSRWNRALRSILPLGNASSLAAGRFNSLL